MLGAHKKPRIHLHVSGVCTGQRPCVRFRRCWFYSMPSVRGSQREIAGT